jgi:predicted NAD-dependent protein-ADP-ribosyltransferase YbiA (DUF1768 family)
MKQPINLWRGEHWFLDNSYETSIMLTGITYPSVSHAFMGAQADTLDLKLQISKSSLNALEHLAELIKNLPADFRGPDTMRQLLERKFGYSTTPLEMSDHQARLAMKLISTGRRPLIYGNTACSNFWGDCTCPKHKDVTGKNVTGGLVMSIRRRLIDNLTRDVAMDQTCACEKPNEAFFLYALNGKLWLKPFCNGCQTQCGMFIASSSLCKEVHRFEKDWVDQKEKGPANQPKKHKTIHQQILHGHTIHPIYREQISDDFDDDEYAAAWQTWGGHLSTKEKPMVQNITYYLSGRIS